MEKQELDKQEMLDSILDNINDYSESANFCDFYNDIFNTDYIIGNYEAEQKLKGFYDENYGRGIFAAINYIKDYEQENFGQINVNDLTSAERLANMIAAVRGEEVLDEVLDDADLSEDDKVSEENAKRVVDAIKEESED